MLCGFMLFTGDDLLLMGCGCFRGLCWLFISLVVLGGTLLGVVVA